MCPIGCLGHRAAELEGSRHPLERLARAAGTDQHDGAVAEDTPEDPLLDRDRFHLGEMKLERVPAHDAGLEDHAMGRDGELGARDCQPDQEGRHAREGEQHEDRDAAGRGHPREVPEHAGPLEQVRDRPREQRRVEQDGPAAHTRQPVDARAIEDLLSRDEVPIDEAHVPSRAAVAPAV